MKKPLQRTQYFLLFSSIFIVYSLILVIISDKTALHLWFNQFHHPIADEFFKRISLVGDGFFALILLPYLFLTKKIKTLLLGIFTCAFAGIFSQFLKLMVFQESLRPSGLFSEKTLHLVEGTDLGTYHLLPSAHTATAFAFCMLCSYIFRKNKMNSIYFALLAILVGISRVYLSQHFLVDVVGGSVLGIFCFVLAFAMVQSIKKKLPKCTLYDYVRFRYFRKWEFF